MKHVALLLMCVLSLVLISGCFTMNQVGTPTESKIEITNKANASTTGQFQRTKKVNHFLWGLISPEDAGVEKLIEQGVKSKGGKNAVNVRMKYQQSFVDGLLGVITFGLYSPFTLTVEGDVVK